MGKLLQAVILGGILIPGMSYSSQRASDSQKTYFSALQCPIAQVQSGTVTLCADSALVVAGGYFLYQCLQSSHPFFSTYTLGLGIKCAAAGVLCRAFITHVFEDKQGLKPTRPNTI
jgi:hypothetical protein